MGKHSGVKQKEPDKLFPVPPGWIMSGYTRIRPGDGNHLQELKGDDTSVKGYRTSNIKLALYVFLNILLCGIPWLMSRWYPQWKIVLTSNPCSLNIADQVLIKDENGEHAICKVKIESLDFLPDEFISRSASVRQLQDQGPKTPLCDAENAGSVYRYFIFQNEKFIWDDDQDIFKKIEGLTDLTCNQILEQFRGMCPNRRQILSSIYGKNEILVEVKSYVRLLFDEVLNPFYLFQVFSVMLWCFDEYYYYAVCVVLISAISIGISLYKTRQQSETLADMARGGDSLVCVRQPDGSEAQISFQDLVPGDVIFIPPEGCIMPCDGILVEGSCIVNESMLTGESVPVNKSAVQPSTDVFGYESHKKHIIFCGTQVIQPRFYAGSKVACIVARTNFCTLKGQLIRSIMYPKELDFKFYADSMKFVLLLFLVAVCGMTYGIYLYTSRGTTWYVLLVRVLDIITIVVPPALPAAMTVGILNAQGRLRKHNIFCISPQRINFCGKLKLVCFDKTGTLTEDGLNLSCVVPTSLNDYNEEEFDEAVTNPKQLSINSPLLRGMATCHSLTFVKDTLVGDPLDLKMFEATGWVMTNKNYHDGKVTLLETPPTKDENSRYDLLQPNVVKYLGTELGIVKEFDFTPQLQRMSVVVTDLETQEMTGFCKGAPEKIRPLCTSVPDNFDKMLDSFTLKGYRVLGLGYKKIVGISWHQLQRTTREKIECDLTFAGFLVMQNSLKPATNPVIKDLTGASVRCLMVTGDNMLTALSVARECGMIPAHEKVVIVNATDEGVLEYTLAAQHYEFQEDEDEGIADTPSSLSLRNNNGGSEVNFVPGRDAHPSRLHELSKGFSLDSIASDTMIDMERLIPIGAAEVLKDVNYHLALTGKTWTYLRENSSKEEFQRIVAKGTVFARMSPECKMQLVEALQEIDYVVAMCGDGANDCSALSAAHVGISLSEAEASVAAPFTSKIADISCVPVLIREGRCALVTSFGIFKYMALYSMVQFASVLILYSHYTNLADAQFLWIDLAITSTVTIAMGRTEPVRRLVSKRPMGSLISFSNVFSIFSQIVACVAIQLGAMAILKQQEWFVPIQPAGADDLETLCWETTTIFSISSFQYLIMSIVFSKGKPFRKPFYLNGYLLGAIVLLTGFTSILMIYPVSFLSSFFSLEPVTRGTQTFRYTLLLFPALNTVVSALLENFVSTSRPVKWFGKSFWKKGPRSQYKEILQNLEKDKLWPPIRS